MISVKLVPTCHEKRKDEKDGEKMRGRKKRDIEVRKERTVMPTDLRDDVKENDQREHRVRYS